MTDLNKAISTSSGAVDLFSSNLSCNSGVIDGEILTKPGEKSQDEIQNELDDPNAFILLLTHIATNISLDEETNQNSTSLNEETQTTGSEIIASAIDLESEIQEKKSEEESARGMENNVAVSWINSQYYQHEIEMRRINSEQEGNLIEDSDISMEQDVVFKETQVNETHVQTTEAQSAIENILIQDEQQSEQSISSDSDLLQNTNSILTSDAQKNIKNALLNPLEHAENSVSTPTSSPGSKEVMNPRLTLDPEFNNGEITVEDKEEKQTSFQPLSLEMENQTEKGVLAPPKPAPLIENAHEIKPPSMGNILTHEARINVPMENHTPAFDPTLQTLTIPIGIDKPEWSQQFSDHIVWLGQQEVKSAVIKIHPEDLGPLEINIKVINDSASVSITIHSHHVREIIDQSLPKLQAMMAEQGLNLSEVQIDSDASPRQFSQQNNDTQEELTHTLEDEMGVTPLKNKKAIKGLVDYFA